ncbi:MAG TPA: 23S rRNA (adenine(2503)-C(2))-methyltransferase RlmN [Lentisphaeria bacterium]|nr:MAG: 23S rRNA (adenine(2503)-C(2))-methyltransferase [Lentisphaerae bacterium GWF2_38_69]HBM16120.1 23S rRNA (adenine(2503)-C(2))-methyltransferase RlmN [Lentisphaeria bacterium]
MNINKKPTIGITYEKLSAVIPEMPGYRVNQIINWVYKKFIINPDLMSNLPADLKAKLKDNFSYDYPKIAESCNTSDRTEKFLIELEDNNCVESVLIKTPDRQTFCLSSQVGCPIKCRFCASGIPDFVRNLTASEIAGQFILLSKYIGKLPDNVVFMGIGEGLLNLKNLTEALNIICSEEYIGYAQRRITISTSGIPKKIDELTALGKQYNLAVSLHAPDDSTRALLIPDKSRFPIKEIIDACKRYFAKTSRLITLEYTLIDGINDSLKQAKSLADIANDLRAKINLIPFNKVEGSSFSRPTRDKCLAFSKELEKSGANVTFRYEKGAGIDAACGQLRAKKLKSI